MKQQKEKKQGRVVETLPNLTFRVKMVDGNIVFAYSSGQMRRNKIRILQGDLVLVELSPLYPEDKKGRIVWRGKRKD